MEKILSHQPVISGHDIWRKRLVNGLLAVICILVIISLAKSWYSYQQSKTIIDSSEEKYRQALEDNETFKRDLARSKSLDFVEKEARQKLNMGRPGEITVLLPTISPAEEPTPTPVENWGNLKKWAELFL
jgi:cell division protein FtsB